MSILEDPDRRDLYGRIADVLIPSSDRLPSATEVGTHEQLIDRALSYRPDLVEAFARALVLCGDSHGAEAVAQLAAESPDEFFALSLLTAGAYYLSPPVRDVLQYHQGRPRPTHDDVDKYVDMLEAVVDRGPIYRGG